MIKGLKMTTRYTPYKQQFKCMNCGRVIEAPTKGDLYGTRFCNSKCRVDYIGH